MGMLYMPRSSDESLSSSNLSRACAMAVVPRLQALDRVLCCSAATTTRPPPLPPSILAAAGLPRPHLHSRSLGGPARRAAVSHLRRRHRQMAVAVDRVKSAHMAMLMPQIALSCMQEPLLGSTQAKVLSWRRWTLTKRECKKLAVLPPLAGNALQLR